MSNGVVTMPFGASSDGTVYSAAMSVNQVQSQPTACAWSAWMSDLSIDIRRLFWRYEALLLWHTMSFFCNVATYFVVHFSISIICHAGDFEQSNCVRHFIRCFLLSKNLLHFDFPSSSVPHRTMQCPSPIAWSLCSFTKHIVSIL